MKSLKQLSFAACTLVFALLILSQCAVFKGNENKIIRITHGTSFGHCRGYCIKEEIYTEKSMTYVKRGWDTTQTKPVSWSFKTKKNNFEDITKRFSYLKFQELDSIIGCPDCADAGAEYLIIETKKGTRKVVFDAYSSPTGIETFLEYIREKRKELELKVEGEN